jgi:uncharacterized protein
MGMDVGVGVGIGSGIFKGLEVRLDPWQVEYGPEIPVGETEATGPVPEAVDDAVERPSAAWQPVRPGPDRVLPRRLFFVDGVRRIEARVIVRRGGHVSHGAFGSYGVGAVEIAGSAHVCPPRIGRVLALDSAEAVTGPVTIGPALDYRAVGTGSADADAPLRRIQVEMRLAEERLARELADRDGSLVVADGPLTFGDPVRGSALGYVKRIFLLYVPEHLETLVRLRAGERTPLFALRSARRFARYSWFLRLADPHPTESPLAGLVRLEVSDAVGLEPALRLADATARLLPPLAPGRGRDPRAPQNLLPIGALEAHLRRELGDSRLIRRHIGAALAEAARA